MEAPNLAQPDSGIEYTVLSGASLNRLGCVVMQSRKVVAYTSCQLKPHEKNYPTHDLELAVVMLKLKIRRHYLYKEKCDLLSEHKSLKYLMLQKDLNICQRRWMKLLKYYDLTIKYHPRKANVMANALSRKTLKDAKCDEYKRRTTSGNTTNFTLGKDGELQFMDRMYVPAKNDLRQALLKEAYQRSFFLHPISFKMYHDLGSLYSWLGMKKEILEYISSYLTYQQVKTEHQVPSGKLYPLEVPKLKWDKITIDFISSFHFSPAKKNVVWVIVDPLTKSTHFPPVHTNYSLEKLVELYLSEIVCIHGIPTCIVHAQVLEIAARNYGNQVTVQYHLPSLDRWAIRNNIIRSCVIDFGINWGRYLPLVEFTYNNSHHASLEMSPFEALYDRQKAYANRERKDISFKYRLMLPPKLSKIHNVFNASMLRRNQSNPDHIVQVETLEVKPN
ncbi:polyprotein [Gossypium australe]|uniref:Polyprotein n=1 Tax=Gossypium australe TaxID=47621 RepID=A0A5B6VNR0_9ROSI|nr:polyprotein [Gossypium australe]